MHSRCCCKRPTYIYVYYVMLCTRNNKTAAGLQKLLIRALALTYGCSMRAASHTRHLLNQWVLRQH